MKCLHVGCGNDHLPDYLAHMDEVRLDIDESVNPDIVASLTDLGDIGTFDALFASHCLEHLYPHEVTQALREFKRVTKGVVIVTVPNLEGLTINDDVLFESPGGEISALDMIYGKPAFIEGSIHMAHHCGFTPALLRSAFVEAGYSKVNIMEPAKYNLGAIAYTGD